jgi:hypothetical protein
VVPVTEATLALGVMETVTAVREADAQVVPLADQEMMT